MTGPPARRYTDREVALVLERAAELEERRGTLAVAGGMTLEQLTDIAREVGLDPALVTEAALELDTRPARSRRSLLGPGLTRKVAHAVPGRLDREALGHLVDRVDGSVAADGIVTEALGRLRWTGGNRFMSTQVAIAPDEAETRIQVSQRFRPQIPAALQLVPGLWGAIAAGSVGATAGLVGLPIIAALAGGAVLGAGVGRLVWAGLSARSGRAVDALGRALAADARRLARTAPESAAAPAVGGDDGSAAPEGTPDDP